MERAAKIFFWLAFIAGFFIANFVNKDGGGAGGPGIAAFAFLFAVIATLLVAIPVRIIQLLWGWLNPASTYEGGDDGLLSAEIGFSREALESPDAVRGREDGIKRLVRIP